MKTVTTEFFIYNLFFSNLTPGSSQLLSLQTQANSRFEVTKLAAIAAYGIANADPNTTNALPLCSVLISDSGSGRQWSDQAVMLTSMFGTGMLPAILPVPRVLPAASQITVQVNNLFTVDSVLLLGLSFIGRKVYG
jgi:hypothetical protein